jgi:hypothetical protein
MAWMIVDIQVLRVEVSWRLLRGICLTAEIFCMSNHCLVSARRQAMLGSLIVAVFGLGLSPAQAGPCSAEIRQFELAVRESAGNPNAGLTAPQSVGAQLDRQPTVDSVKRAEQRLKSKFSADMARARRLDAQGDRAGCTRALNAAKRMYIL